MNLSSSQYVQGVPKIFVNSSNLIPRHGFVNELSTKKYRPITERVVVAAMATTEHEVRTSWNNMSKKVLDWL